MANSETTQGMSVVCVLRSSDHERKSFRGRFQWPESGPVEAPDWKQEAECGNGLHGLLWGIGDWSLCRCNDTKAVWQVVEVEESLLVDLEGKVKFPRGNVIYSGSLSGAMSLITKRHFEQVLLQKATSGNYAAAATSGEYAPAATSGFYAAAATSGFYAPAATLGEYAPAATSGDRSPAATSGEYAPAATSGDRSPAATSGDRSPAATLGYHGKAKAGPNSSIILTYADNTGRPRHVVGYTGENGIEPHVWYELNNAHELTKCVNQDVLTPEGFMR